LPEYKPRTADGEKGVTSRAPPRYDGENREIGDEVERNASGLGTRNMPDYPKGQRECAQKRAIDNRAVNPGRPTNLPRQARGLGHAREFNIIPRLSTLPSVLSATIP